MDNLRIDYRWVCPEKNEQRCLCPLMRFRSPRVLGSVPQMLVLVRGKPKRENRSILEEGACLTRLQVLVHCVSRIQSKSKPVARKPYSEAHCVPLTTFHSKISWLDQRWEHCSDQTYIKWAFHQKQKWMAVTCDGHFTQTSHPVLHTHNALFLLLRKCIHTRQQLRVRCCCF